AESRAVLRGRIGAEPQPVRRSERLQIAHHDTRLYPGEPVDRVELQDRVHMPGEVDHDPLADGIARDRGSPAPAGDGYGMGTGDVKDRYDVTARAWEDDDLRQQAVVRGRSEEHTSELQSRFELVCRLLLDK